MQVRGVTQQRAGGSVPTRLFGYLMHYLKGCLSRLSRLSRLRQTGCPAASTNKDQHGEDPAGTQRPFRGDQARPLSAKWIPRPF